MNKIKANIKNLTSLWKSVSEPFGAFHHHPDFDYAWLEDSGWPNRLWFKKPLQDLDLSQIRLHQAHLGLPLKIPYWEIESHDHELSFHKEGFTSGTVQIGMSLPLNNQSVFPDQMLKAELVSDTRLSKIWSNLFQKAFGYYINPKQLSGSKNTFCYVYAHQNEHVGTGLLHITEHVAGIHAIGVPPDHRRKGYAESVMFHLLNQALSHQCKLSTLQASDLGKGLYLKLGYQEDFKIHNYTLNL